ncbi:MAG TPA: hypothetical protein VF116_07270 [Ktedonobacterales bacterium]
MSTQPRAERRRESSSGAITPAPAEAGSQRMMTPASGIQPSAPYRHPPCLLAIGIHEIGRTAGTLRFARALGNDALARRVKGEQEGWSHLYEFTAQRICPALRTEPIEPEAASVFADAALAAMPATVPNDILAYLRRRLTSCAVYRNADDCPFLNPRESGESEAESGDTAHTHEPGDGGVG